MHDLSDEALIKYWSFELKWREFIAPLCPPSLVSSSWFWKTGVFKTVIVVSYEAAANLLPKGL